MIKVHIYDYGCGKLDIEKRLGLDEDVCDLLISRISGLEFEGTDNICDLDDNWVFWFSADDEEAACRDIKEILNALDKETQIRYSVEMTEKTFGE